MVCLHLLASAPAAPPPGIFVSGLQLSIVGMVVVFFALIAIWALLMLVRQTGRSAEQYRDQPPAPAPAPAASAPPSSPQAPAQSNAATQEPAIPPDIMAVLIAAVTVVVGRPARIVNVRQISQVGPSDAWATSGRTAIHTSHLPRK